MNFYLDSSVVLRVVLGEARALTEWASGHRRRAFARAALAIDLVLELVNSVVVKTVNVHEAKTHLSRLLKGVTRGNEVVIARGGKPIARLLPLERARPLPVLGADRGKFTVPEDFDAPLPEAVLAAFEGKSRRR